MRSVRQQNQCVWRWLPWTDLVSCRWNVLRCSRNTIESHVWVHMLMPFATGVGRLSMSSTQALDELRTNKIWQDWTRDAFCLQRLPNPHAVQLSWELLTSTELKAILLPGGLVFRRGLCSCCARWLETWVKICQHVLTKGTTNWWWKLARSCKPFVYRSKSSWHLLTHRALKPNSRTLCSTTSTS